LELLKTFNLWSPVTAGATRRRIKREKAGAVVTLVFILF
jgi:hypothetical protein